MIEKMLKKLEELRMSYFLTIANGGDGKLDFVYGYIGETIDRCKEIVQEVAKEYGKDTNVRSNGWVPCSERLPEAHKNVLVCENDGEIHLCRYNANMKRFFYDGSDWDIKLSEVIAWQPLPAPFKKGV